MSDALFDLAPTEFQMQSWHNDTKTSTRSWEPMEIGTAPKIWAPRSRAEEAVHKCLEWTGTLCIPAMRVVDLTTGEVVWQDTTRYPEAGDMVMPAWAPAIYQRLRAGWPAESAAEVMS